jgi:hypothetical protein
VDGKIHGILFLSLPEADEAALALEAQGKKCKIFYWKRYPCYLQHHIPASRGKKLMGPAPSLAIRSVDSGAVDRPGARAVSKRERTVLEPVAVLAAAEKT